jgi:hypothetical protein
LSMRKPISWSPPPRRRPSSKKWPCGSRKSSAGSLSIGCEVLTFSLLGRSFCGQNLWLNSRSTFSSMDGGGWRPGRMWACKEMCFAVLVVDEGQEGFKRVRKSACCVVWLWTGHELLVVRCGYVLYKVWCLCYCVFCHSGYVSHSKPMGFDGRRTEGLLTGKFSPRTHHIGTQPLGIQSTTPAAVFSPTSTA